MVLDAVGAMAAVNVVSGAAVKFSLSDAALTRGLRERGRVNEAGALYVQKILLALSYYDRFVSAQRLARALQAVRSNRVWHVQS